LVSVVTPTYNSAKYIGALIESIQAQTYQNWELLITDDCSEDETVEIIKQYAANDKRIKFFTLDSNSGAGIARNNSIQYASGRFIAFCDSDDRWLSKKLQTQLDFMEKHNLVCTYSSYYTCDENGEITGAIDAVPKMTYSRMLTNNYIGNLTFIYDTAAVGKVFMPELRKRQDWALGLRVMRKAKSTLGIKEPLAIYRKRQDSISSDKLELLRYNFLIYRKELLFSVPKSYFYMLIFLVSFFLKKVAQISKRAVA